MGYRDEAWGKIRGRIERVIVEDDFVQVNTDEGAWAFRPEGDCCAHAYVHEPEDVNGEYFVGATIYAAEVNEGEPHEQGSEYRDCHFYELRTSKGVLTITLYVDHNGYYCGWLNPTAIRKGKS